MLFETQGNQVSRRWMTARTPCKDPRQNKAMDTLGVMIAVVPVVRTTGLGALQDPRQPRKDSRMIVYWSKSETDVGLTRVYLPESA